MLSITIGPMFSGKTTSLVNHYKNNKNNKLVIDYDIDNDNIYLETHDNIKVPCVKVKKLLNIEVSILVDTVYINEAQFFEDLYLFVKQMLFNKKDIYIYGLDGDYKQEKIGNIIDLIPICDNIIKLNGNCYNCKNLSIFSKRIINNKEQYLPDEKYYLPVCRKCLII